MSRGNHDDKTLEELPGPDGRPSVHDDIHVILECDRPLAGSTRYCIEHVDRVVLRRGPNRGATREVEGGLRTLALEVPDLHMSSSHATLQRFAGQWVFEDANSRNGSYLQGRRVAGAALTDGHVLQLGHTFFLFRSSDLPKSAVASSSSRDSAIPTDDGGVPTSSHALEANVDHAADALRSGTSVLIVGEIGSGKSTLARALHARASVDAPFVLVSCAELGVDPADEIAAAFARATGGTLFLDEIDGLGASAQRALSAALRARSRTKGPGVVCALRSNERPTQTAGIAADLFAQLSGFWLPVPPLRDRIEDLGGLVAAILAATGDRGSFRLDPAMGQALALHDWPYNVRELEDCLRSSALEATDHCLRWSPPSAIHASAAIQGLAIGTPTPAYARAPDPVTREGSGRPPPPRESASHHLALDVQDQPHEDFAHDVRRALKCNLSPHLLQRNGLLASEMVLEATQGATAISVTVPALREQVLSAIESLRQSTARGAKQAAVLQLTFIEPTPTQQEAADRLGMAFGTYRRHVTAGLVELTGILWFREQAAARRRVVLDAPLHEEPGTLGGRARLR